MGWIAVNFLRGRFNPKFVNEENTIPQRKTLGFLDIGGASAQIAFAPIKRLATMHKDDLKPIKIRYSNGMQIDLSVFVGTFLGFGMAQLRERYIESAKPPMDYKVTSDPCLPTGYRQEVELKDTAEKMTLAGVGNFNSCYNSISPLMNKMIACSEDPCLFNGLHAPIVDFRNHHFVGVSNVWYTTFQVYDLGSNYSYSTLFKGAKEFCETPWDKIRENFKDNRYPHVNYEGILAEHW